MVSEETISFHINNNIMYIIIVSSNFYLGINVVIYYYSQLHPKVKTVILVHLLILIKGSFDLIVAFEYM